MTIPEHTLHALDRYMLHGQPPSSGQLAILEGSLFGAYTWLDGHTQDALPAIVRHIQRHFPTAAYGSPAKVAQWIDLGGQRGIDISRREAAHGIR